MSLNRFMHSRNIYRTKPDFAEMAKTYPSFGVYVKTDLRGKVVFDYNDSNALRELTKTLLKKDFDLKVDIPHNRLIPTVPQRLNYILYIEDLVLKLIEFLKIENKEIVGLDIGTGSCAIFPLIGCVINKNWRFVATDVDPINIECARNNVNNNELNQRIKVIECKEENSFTSIVNTMNQRIHFLMTNPPFFSDNFNDSDVSKDESDIQMKRTHNYHKKSLANTSNPIESIVVGGEVEFVSRIIEQSLVIRDKVMIYSSMFGKKQSLKQIKNIIKSYVQKGIIFSFNTTEFCQGFTKRWGIAWTFIEGLNLKSVPITKSVKPKSPLVYYLPPILKGIDYNIQSISQKIKSLLINDLRIDSFEMRETKKLIEFRIKANINTWSHQRKRKRNTKLDCNSNTKIVTNDSNLMTQIVANEESFNKCTQDLNLKRSLELMDCDEENPLNVEMKKTKTRKEYLESESSLLDCTLAIKRDKQTIFIEMQRQPTELNNESTYQLFQFFKNNLI